MMRTTSFSCLLVLSLILSITLFAPAVQASDTDHRPFLTLYAGQGVDSNLVDIFPRMFKGDLDFDDTYLYALGYFHPHATPELLQKAFDLLWIPNMRAGWEFVVGKHDGLQHNWETNVAWQLRFAPLRIYQLNIRPGIGLGLSYALGTPTYEDGPLEDPEKRYRLQNFNIYELEWSLSSAPRIAMVTRIHHRSGIYGIIAPRRVGSNFLTLGLRYSF
jgi:hypothetical protein